MQKALKLLAILLLPATGGYAQAVTRLVKDLDGDHKKDTVYIDGDLKKIFCSLSTRQYRKISSEEIWILNLGNMLAPTKNGFEFWNDYGRSGFINEFRYNAGTRKIQLVKITRTDYNLDYTTYGGEVRDGNGKSTINLVTHKYVGNFYDFYQGKLRRLPTINAVIPMPETTLETFSDAVYFDYEKQCVALYEKASKETK